MTTVCAIVVCYRPSQTELMRLVKALDGQVSSILIMNNGGIASDLLEELGTCSKVRTIDMGENLGIASALNRAFDEIGKSGYEFGVTFDQDSQPSPNHVPALVNAWQRLSSKSSVSSRIGAIGASFYDLRDGRFDYPFVRAKGFKVEHVYESAGEMLPPVDSLITSGMLVPVEIWQEFHFVDNLFVDYVDTEWCFRTKSAGYQHYGSFEVKMLHELSDSKPIKLLGINTLRYSALRRYYYFRNGAYLATRSYVPMIFRVRLITGMIIRTFTIPIIDPHPIKSLKYIFRGLCDAAAGRFGRLDG